MGAACRANLAVDLAARTRKAATRGFPSPSRPRPLWVCAPPRMHKKQTKTSSSIVPYHADTMVRVWVTRQWACSVVHYSCRVELPSPVHMTGCAGGQSQRQAHARAPKQPCHHAAMPPRSHSILAHRQGRRDMCVCSAVQHKPLRAHTRTPKQPCHHAAMPPRSHSILAHRDGGPADVTHNFLRSLQNVVSWCHGDMIGLLYKLQSTQYLIKQPLSVHHVTMSPHFVGVSKVLDSCVLL